VTKVAVLYFIAIQFRFAIGTEGKNLEFLKWFSSNGGEVHGLTIAEFDGMGRGIQAINDIESEKRVLFIPSSIIFSKRNLDLSSKSDKVLDELSKKYSDDSEEAVTIWLLLEYKRGLNSFFKPYIDVLPIYVPSILYFTTDELSELQSPELSEEAASMQSDLNANFKKFQQKMSSHWPFPIHNVSLEEYQWAASIVSSRGLRFQGEVYLSPMADMFNYSPQDTIRVAGNGESFLRHHILGSDGSITILSDRNAVKGTQLFEDYGDNTDDLYLKYHGFVAIGNPFTCVKIDVKKVLKVLPALTATQSQILRLFDVRFHPALFSCIDKNVNLGKALEIFLSVLALDDTTSQHCLSVLKENPKKWNILFEGCSINSITSYIYKHDSKEIEWDPKIVPMGKKALKVLRDVMTVGMIVLYQSTPDADRKKLASLQQTLATCPSQNIDTSIIPKKNNNKKIDEDLSECHDEKKKRSLIRHILAVQYRLQKKELWMVICHKFDHPNCWPKIPEPPTTKAAATLLKNTMAKNELEQKLEVFNTWFKGSQPSPAKIAAAYIPGFRIGTVAVDTIESETTYLGVPTSIILDSESAFQSSSLGDLIKQLSAKYKTRDDFHELLLFLIHETFVSGARSPYWPYLHLLPRLEEMDNPILWSNATLLQRLSPSHLLPEVMRYRNSVFRRFNAVKKIDIITSHFPAGIFSWDTYLWASVILDSRSIWWGGQRHLVPMLDFINCAELANPKRVHSTSLDTTSRYAETKAGARFVKGEQVFENYGQPNHVYFLYHGFSIQNNSHDCVHWNLQLTKAELSAANSFESKQLLEKLRMDKGDGSLDICLAYPVPPYLWMFLALKMDNVDSLKRKNLLGEPTAAAASLLDTILDTQIAKYASYNSSHAASSAFIASELSLLQSTKEQLNRHVLKKPLLPGVDPVMVDEL